MVENLSKEQFDLIRKVLREKAGSDVPGDRPLKKPRKRWLRSSGSEPTPGVSDTLLKENIERSKVKDNNGLNTEQPEVIDLESGDENNVNESVDSSQGHVSHIDDGNEDEDEDEDFDSSDFEDVFDPTLDEDNRRGEDLSITIQNDSLSQLGTGKTSHKRNESRRNVCSNEERKRRRFLHMLTLLCLMVHCSIRNQWLSDPKLFRKLSKLVPDKTFYLLHPEKDEEMPLRSTRKLLDGLKQCMKLWEKHWRVTQSYDFFGLYMPEWDDYPQTTTTTMTNHKAQHLMDKKTFVKQVIKGIGNRDLATQGFVALLRSCDVNARLIMSCQPPDFTNLKLDTLSSKKNIDISEASELFKYPIFWCEVWDKFSKNWITIDPTNLKTIEQVRVGGVSKLEPRGTVPSKRNLLRYVVAFDRKDGCRDVTRRYARWYNSKVRKRRVTKDPEGETWFNKVIARLHLRKRMKTDDYEDEFFEERNKAEGIPDNLQDLKNHPVYILEKDMGKNQILQAGAKECGYLKLHGRANRRKVGGVDKVLKVYNRKDIITLKSARQWYMEGRILKTGSMCKKVLPRHNSKDQEESEERLYSFDDTELYVPPLADDSSGEIVKNAFGNIEVFVPSMIPQNCVLIESPHAIQACKRLRIPYARAVTSFKFERGKHAKAVISGVVVLAVYRESVEVCIDALEYEQSTKEQHEMELSALQQWRLLLAKLRIKDELNMNYGHVADKDGTDLYGESGGFFIPSEPGPSQEEPHEGEVEEDEGGQGGFLPQVIRHNGAMDGDDVSLRGEISDQQMNVSDNQSTTSSDSKLDDEYADFMDELGMSSDLDN